MQLIRIKSLSPQAQFRKKRFTKPEINKIVPDIQAEKASYKKNIHRKAAYVRKEAYQMKIFMPSGTECGQKITYPQANRDSQHRRP